jgi:hypothetical protein
MEPAFSTFREPHAWLIRGLVEYGWPDVSLASGRVPSGVFGGFSLANFSSSSGRQGITLYIPAALPDGQQVEDDGVYEFVICLTRDNDGNQAFAVRCPEANYLQLFTIDPANPPYAAGFIHQGLTGYLPEFIRWRLSGGQVTWAQRAGLPTINGEPCSSPMAQFIGSRLQSRSSLDLGPSEGWWLNQSGATPMVAQNTFATLGQAAQDEIALGSMSGAGRNILIEAVSSPGRALLLFASFGIFEGVLCLLNALLTLGLYSGGMLANGFLHYLLGLVFSVVVGLMLMLGGAAALMGGRSYRQLKGGILPWVSMAYALVLPGCCMLGIPASLWAAYVWTRPQIASART